jgi:hypothetical protein
MREYQNRFYDVIWVVALTSQNSPIVTKAVMMKCVIILSVGVLVTRARES